MSYFDEERRFPKGDCSESDFYKIKYSKIVKNDVMLLKDWPCKKVAGSTTRLSKHGCPRKYLIDINIFTNEKCKDMVVATADAIVANVLETEYQLMGVSDMVLNHYLMKPQTRQKNMKLPTNDIGKQIKEKFNSDETIKVTVVKYMGEEHIVLYKLENY